MKTKIGIIVFFALAVATVLFFPDLKARLGPAPTEISVLYSTEKKDWIEAAAASFAAQHPEIKVTLTGRGSLDAARDILEGRERPTIFGPADSLVLRLLESDYRTKTGRELTEGGDQAPQPLVLSPLVFAMWEERATPMLAAGGGALSWKVIHDAVASAKGWPAVGGKAEWGFVLLGHTDPLRSNSGLQALYSMTLEFYGRTRGIQVAEILDPKYQAWVGEIERGVSRFEPSTGTFMTDMIRFGPSKYDVAVVYESLAISQLKNAQGRWGNLKIYYPATTLWSDHPQALLKGDWVSPAQKQAAAVWTAHLRSREVQASALTFGFRPADPSVPIKTADPNNPFTSLGEYGVRLELPTSAEIPDGPVLRNLLTMWSRVVKPNAL